MFNVITGPIGVLVSKWPYLKTAGCRAEWAKIYSGVLVAHTVHVYGVPLVSYCSRSFCVIQCICVKRPVLPKRLTVEENGLKLGYDRGTFDLVVSNVLHVLG